LPALGGMLWFVGTRRSDSTELGVDLLCRVIRPGEGPYAYGDA
jgi:hypothetical protein